MGTSRVLCMLLLAILKTSSTTADSSFPYPPALEPIKPAAAPYPPAVKEILEPVQQIHVQPAAELGHIPNSPTKTEHFPYSPAAELATPSPSPYPPEVQSISEEFPSTPKEEPYVDLRSSIPYPTTHPVSVPEVINSYNYELVEPQTAVSYQHPHTAEQVTPSSFPYPSAAQPISEVVPPTVKVQSYVDLCSSLPYPAAKPVIKPQPTASFPYPPSQVQVIAQQPESEPCPVAKPVAVPEVISSYHYELVTPQPAVSFPNPPSQAQEVAAHPYAPAQQPASEPYPAAKPVAFPEVISSYHYELVKPQPAVSFPCPPSQAQEVAAHPYALAQRPASEPYPAAKPVAVPEVITSYHYELEIPQPAVSFPYPPSQAQEVVLHPYTPSQQPASEPYPAAKPVVVPEIISSYNYDIVKPQPAVSFPYPPSQAQGLAEQKPFEKIPEVVSYTYGLVKPQAVMSHPYPPAQTSEVPLGPYPSATETIPSVPYPEKNPEVVAAYSHTFPKPEPSANNLTTSFPYPPPKIESTPLTPPAVIYPSFPVEILANSFPYPSATTEAAPVPFPPSAETKPSHSSFPYPAAGTLSFPYPPARSV